MGISTYISLNKFNFNVSLQVVTKILKRTFLILCIGWAIGWFDHVCEGDFLPFVHLRIPGVLQRIALCYCVISFTALFMNHKFIPALTFILLVVTLSYYAWGTVMPAMKAIFYPLLTGNFSAKRISIKRARLIRKDL